MTSTKTYQIKRIAEIAWGFVARKVVRGWRQCEVEDDDRDSNGWWCGPIVVVVCDKGGG